MTYWNSKGTHQELADKLQKLVPASGPVMGGKKNAKLEKFRRAVNAYYDIFNNGGCNRGAQIRSIFKFSMRAYAVARYGHDWNGIHAVVEPIMDRIILEAAEEQGLL
jgi:hypothetical protein